MSSGQPSKRSSPRRRVIAARPVVGSTSSSRPLPATDSTNAATEASHGFFFSSLSDVWTGLKAAAAHEVGEFVKGLSGGEQDEVEQDAKVGGKRKRDEQTTGTQRTGQEQERTQQQKRRKRDNAAVDDFLFDGVPPLMPPIAHSSMSGKRKNPDFGEQTASSSSRVPAASSRSSTSPSAYRRLLPWSSRGDSAYEDELMRSKNEGEGLSSTSALAQRPSSGIFNRKDASGSAVQSESTKSQSVRASSSSNSLSGSAIAKAVWSSWSFSQHLLAGGSSSTSTSTSAPELGSLQAKTSRRSLADELAANDIKLSHALQEVAQTWEAAKQADQPVEQLRIAALEAEVKALRNELSVQRAFNSPASAFAKAPRVSAAPPPPPPPVGRPNPTLLTARAQLRATPERPNRRHSTMGGVPLGLDMTKFMSEVGDKRQKLRRFGLPKEKTQEELRRERVSAREGTGNESLQRALKRKQYQRSNGPPAPMTPYTSTASVQHTSSSAVSINQPTSPAASTYDPTQFLQVPKGGFASATSAPGNLAQLGGGGSHNSLSPRARGGKADEPMSPMSITGNDASHETAQDEEDEAEVVIPMVGDADVREVDNAGPEQMDKALHSADEAAHPHRPSAKRPHRSMTQPSSPVSFGQSAKGAALTRPLSSPPKRDSAMSKRQSNDKLPGLDLGRSRPLTPSRQKSKAVKSHKRAAQDSPTGNQSEEQSDQGRPRPPLSPHPNSVTTSPRSPRSPRTVGATKSVARRRTNRSRAGEVDTPDVDGPSSALDQLVADADATLTGQGELSPDPTRIFGRA
ncbi:hypothetical protein JCM10908_003988 [Rhodotorula pacifica]|uniref:uncharacterized protein n=1 Tax=Rhodotorula pacifica TaxID=1495444 RepID=UPI00316B65D1